MAFYDVTITWRTRVEVDTEHCIDEDAIKIAASEVLGAEFEDSPYYLQTGRFEIQEVY